MDYSFKKFQKDAISRLLSFEKYEYIINNLNSCNVSSDQNFQKNFTAFYVVRRNEEWRKEFYSYFEKAKKNKYITFGEILKELKKRTGFFEASFSSKLLSTINPDMPIWDQFVLKELKVKINKHGDRTENIIKAYEEIIHKEKELLKRNDVKESIKQFRKLFPEYSFSDIKILDYIIWNNNRNA